MRLAPILLALLLAPAAAAHAGILDPGLAPVPTLAPPSLPAPSPVVSDDGSYTIRFQCVGTGQDTAAATVTCPAYVLDREDIMSQPVLLVDPARPDLVAFSAMHGGRGVHQLPGDEPPTERSRDNALHQPHTTFMSKDGGATWEDLPYHAPDSMVQPGRQIFGEDNAATLDGNGTLYLANIYTHRAAPSSPFATPPPFQYAVGVWKQHGLSRPTDYHANTKVLAPAEGSVVDSVFLVHVPGADRVVVLWREMPADGAPFVQAYWTRPSDGALWSKVEDQGIAGCTAISNPIAIRSTVYVACREGEAWATFGLDAASWKAARVDSTPLTDAHALLVKRGEDGYMVLIGSGLAPDNTTAAVHLAYGEMGARWSSADDIGPRLTAATPSSPLADARVTAAAYAPVSGNLHLLYLERTDASRVANANQQTPEFRKVFASIQAEGAFQGLVDLQVGRLTRADFSPAYTGVGNGAYSDLHDGLVVVQTSGGTREFLAYGDYGFVRFAEVVEENFLPPISLPTAPPPAVPLASGGIAPVLYGAPAGLLAGAMVVRTLMARRKTVAEAPTQE